MKVRHRIHIHAVCPVNGDPDHYVCDVFPTSLLYCEKVEEAVATLTKTPVTQETLTQNLADQLGYRVRTRGTHCRGRVETTVVCNPNLEQSCRTKK